MNDEEVAPLIENGEPKTKRRVSYAEPSTPSSPEMGTPLSGKPPGFPSVIVPRRKVIIEPVLFMYCMALIGSAPVIEQYLFSRFAQKYPSIINGSQGENSSSESVCYANQSDPIFIATQSVQSETSRWQMYLQVVSTVPAIIATLFLGSYSDKAGRKVVILLASASNALKFILNCFIIYFDLSVYYFLIGQIFEGMTGGFAAIMMVVFAYLADITTPEQRGLRITIAEGCLTLALAISQLGLGYFIKATNFFYPYLTLTLILIVNILYILFFVPETIVRQKERRFSMTDSLKKTYNVYTNKVEKRNIKLALLIIATFFATMPLMSRFSIQILFIMGFPLCWDSIKIGIFLAVTAVTVQVGAILGLLAFKRCGFGEVLIAGIGILSSVGSSLFNAWASEDFMMYIVCFANLFMMLSVPMFRTMCSRLVNKMEQGTVFSGLACIETIASTCGSLVFTAVYQSTLHLMNGGFVFLIYAAVNSLTIIFLIPYSIISRSMGPSPLLNDIIN